MSEVYFFKDVTLLITHYNRSKSLERLLSSLARLKCTFEEIVVSDDASRPEEMAQVLMLQKIYNYRLLAAPVNKGYGNCLNKGFEAIKTPYTLYVQEDFVPFDIFPQHFKDALDILNEEKSIDYIRFWAIGDPKINLKPYAKGFSEMVYRFWNMSHLKFYQFSDTPNIRRSNFTEKFGRYREGIHGDLTDYYMAISFLHHKGKGLFYDEYASLFTHDDEEEGSRIRARTNWRQREHAHIRMMRWCFLRYKWLKGTWLVLFYNKRNKGFVNAAKCLLYLLPTLQDNCEDIMDMLEVGF